MRARSESEDVLAPAQLLDEIFPTFLFNDMQDQVKPVATELEENLEKLEEFYQGHQHDNKYYLS